MNKSKVEQGIANYLSAVIADAIAAGDIPVAEVQVLPGKSDTAIAPAIPKVFAILERLPNVVGPIYHGEVRIQVQKPGEESAIGVFRAVLDAVGTAFPPQGTSGYADAKIACAAAIAAAADGVVCTGWSITDGGEDVEDEKRWIDDLTLRFGLKDP